MTTLPYMASVRTRDPDALCYTTQNMWACYSLTIPKPTAIPAHHTRKRIQPQIADKASALQMILDQYDLDCGSEWDLETLVSQINYYGGWKPFNMARAGGISGDAAPYPWTYEPPEEVNPFQLYDYETYGFTALLADILSGKPSWGILLYGSGFGVVKRSEKLKIRKDYDEVADFVYAQSRLINFATYAGAKMWCQAAAGAITCEIDNTETIPRTLINRETGETFYSKGAKYGHKIIVSTWVDSSGNLSVRWAKSYPVYSNPEAFKLIASS